MAEELAVSIVRAVRRTDRTPILMLSARGTTSDRIAGLEAGADDYLPKPFSPAELVLRVRSILRRTGGTAAPRPGDDPARSADPAVPSPPTPATSGTPAKWRPTSPPK